LRRIVHGSEFGDGLLGPVIENVEVCPMQAFDEFAAGVGDNDAYVDALDGEADGWGRGRWRFLRVKRKYRKQKDQREKAEPTAANAKGFASMRRTRKERPF
jgi:hypothetical protein